MGKLIIVDDDTYAMLSLMRGGVNFRDVDVNVNVDTHPIPPRPPRTNGQIGKTKRSQFSSLRIGTLDEKDETQRSRSMKFLRDRMRGRDSLTRPEITRIVGSFLTEQLGKDPGSSTSSVISAAINKGELIEVRDGEKK